MGVEGASFCITLYWRKAVSAEAVWFHKSKTEKVTGMTPEET